MDARKEHFKHKFTASEGTPANVEIIRKTVQSLRERLHCKAVDGFKSVSNQISKFKIKNYVKALKNNSASGYDGISGEHLKIGMCDKLLVILSNIFSICLKYGVIPEYFNYGIVVPVLKKATMDPSEPVSYRPITVSCVMSKILEMFILEHCQDYQPSKAQFGFIPGRSTCMATVLANDVGAYCVSQGSPMFCTSLDIESAFDRLPHCVILMKAWKVIPEPMWLLLYNWYTNMYVTVRWNSSYSEMICVERGTKQGGLTPTMLFNIFYIDLMHALQASECGARLGKKNFNNLCYADDILLCSLTVTGLQSLIDLCVKYVSNYGLRFNPAKTG